MLNMKLYLWSLHVMSIFVFGSSYDPFAGFVRLGPCYKVQQHPDCKKPLKDSFTPQNEVAGGNPPETWINLFTWKDEDTAEPLHECGGDLPENSIYDRNMNTTFIIHGFLDGVCRTAWMRELMKQLFFYEDMNVVLVDWTWGNLPDEVVAIENAKVVGEQLGFIINNIINNAKVSPDNFHIIGHSLGSVIAGYIGKYVKGIRRITALDPSFQAIRNLPPELRLSHEDAKLVDVIYTSNRDCNTLASLSYQFCYHLQSIQYFKASINANGCEFVAVESESYAKFQEERSGPTAVMGYGIEKYPLPDGIRKYYLDTALECPYVDNSKLKDVDPSLIEGC